MGCKGGAIGKRTSGTCQTLSDLACDDEIMAELRELAAKEKKYVPWTPQELTIIAEAKKLNLPHPVIVKYLEKKTGIRRSRSAVASQAQRLASTF